jgi:uncharacterized protein YbjT (DUF2867 family)
MFVITGITGKVGGEVERNLLAGNQPVRAAVRDLRKGEPWAQLGCDLVRADINDVRPVKLLKMIVWRGGTRSDRASHRT